MLLGIKQNEQIVLRAEGDDEREALGRLAEFLADASMCAPPTEHANAGEACTPGQQQGMQQEGAGLAFRGVAASEGLAFGQTYAYFREEIVADRQSVAPHEVADELHRFGVALEDTLRSMLEQRGDAGAHDEIFDAIAELARSDDFAGAIRALVSSQWSAEAATLKCGLELAVAFATLPDEYLRSRADDIRGLTRAVAASLLGKPLASLSELPGPRIVLADDLSAPDLARADLRNILGIVCASGSATWPSSRELTAFRPFWAWRPIAKNCAPRTERQSMARAANYGSIIRRHSSRPCRGGSLRSVRRKRAYSPIGTCSQVRKMVDTSASRRTSDRLPKSKLRSGPAQWELVCFGPNCFSWISAPCRRKTSSMRSIRRSPARLHRFP
jgi:hypothetical protein